MAIQLVQFAYFKTVLERDNEGGKRAHDSEEEDEDEENEADDPRPAKKARTSTGGAAAVPKVSNLAEILPNFRKVLNKMFDDSRADKIPLAEILQTMSDSASIGENGVHACIAKLAEDNKVMLAENEVYRV